MERCHVAVNRRADCPVAVMDRHCKRYFSEGPTGAQPRESPLRYPGRGDVTRRLHPAPSLGERVRQLASRMSHAREKALAQGVGGAMPRRVDRPSDGG